MKKLFIDIETFSSEDLKKTGVYKYVQSPDFQIILIAYAIEDQPIEIIEGPNKEFKELFYDPEFIKISHNTNFERTAFDAIGWRSGINDWEDSMIKSAYYGYPLSLNMSGEALGIDNKKLKSGTLLLKYFTGHVKPTKTNGKRKINLPEDNPEKWQLLKEYAIRDVESMREIYYKLPKEPIPEFEQKIFELDQKINDKGVYIDNVLVQRAITLSEQSEAELILEMKKITGLENPASVAQLKKWLSGKTEKEIKTLNADAVMELIEEFKDYPEIVRILELRKRISKTSIKKYIAMKNVMSDDDRARGLFQYYGAARTGRWSGRLIQLQNLPRNYLEDLEKARERVKTLSLGELKQFYDDIPYILSNLTRTAFIAETNHILVVTDFSAIEARVLPGLQGRNGG